MKLCGIPQYMQYIGGIMDAIIYTRDDTEYDLIKEMLERGSAHMDVYRHPLNGHKRYDNEYDIVIVALNGAEGMEVMLEYVQRFPDTSIIWITDDPFFAGIALRNHIYDFIERPYAQDRLEQSIRDVIANSPNRNRWVYPAKKKEELLSEAVQ